MAGLSFAKFVIHYKDGSTLIEDKKDDYCWNNASKDNISALGILFDPLPLYDDNRPVLSDDGRQLRLTFDEHTLKGSKTYKYGFFMDKEIIFALGKSKTLNRGRNEISLGIGMVIDSEGHCICMRGTKDRQIYTYYTTVHSLGMDQNSLTENYNIDLGECGKRIDGGHNRVT